jgi:hypothetical protein
MPAPVAGVRILVKVFADVTRAAAALTRTAPGAPNKRRLREMQGGLPSNETTS